MNFLTLNKPHATYQLISMILLGFTLFLTSTFSISATLPSGANTPPTELGREFNHLTTGFPLLGEHATIECATCHLNGVFKGTPKNCTGCHVKGQRIVATTMSAKHIPTNERCELCHSNSVTFYGAKFSHIGSNVIVGGCRTCHNGMTAEGRPTSSHATGARLTDSCDKCHRTTAWFPAGYSHAGVVPGSCASCHNGVTAIGKPGSHSTGIKLTGSCDLCHYTTGWAGAFFNHLDRVSDCSSAGCHGADVTGRNLNNYTFTSITTITGTSPHTGSFLSSCKSCHTNYTTFFNALYKPHAAGVCSACHTVLPPISSHSSATGKTCNSCHTSTDSWYGALGAMPANHIPYKTGVTCGTCHTGTGIVNVTTLHNNSNLADCNLCHLKGNPYSNNNQQTRKQHGSSNCTSCHKSAGTYLNWSE